MHPSLPLPVNPGRQVHAMSCTVVVHTALAPHLKIMQALMQDPVWQTSEVRQSEFVLHCGTALTEKIHGKEMASYFLTFLN
jgi:hypothetical protein